MISESEIYTAAERFVEENGRTATWREMRGVLCGGSPTTLNKYYRPWRSAKDSELTANRSEIAPGVQKVPVPDALMSAIADAWSQAISELTAEAKREQEVLKALYRKESDLLLEKVAELDEIINTLESEAVEHQELCEKSMTLLKVQIDALHEDLGEKTAEVEYKRRELGTQNGRILELEKQLSIERETVANERSQADIAKAESAKLTAELKILKKSKGNVK